MKNILSSLLLSLFILPLMGQTPVQINSTVVSNNELKSMNQEEIDRMTIVQDGYYLLNKTTGCFNYYVNHHWNEFCGTCLPKPVTHKMDSFFVSYNDIMLFSNSWQQRDSQIVVACLLPDSIVQYTKTGKLVFANLKPGKYTIRYYTKNTCGNGKTFELNNIEVKSMEFCKTVENETIVFNGIHYTSQSLGRYCWLTQDIRSTSGRKQKDYYSDPVTNINYYPHTILLNKAVCPDGWHLPDITEATELLGYINDNPERLKLLNASKGGFYDATSKKVNKNGASAYWVQDNAKLKNALIINPNGGNVIDITNEKNEVYLSVRCVKN